MTKLCTCPLALRASEKRQLAISRSRRFISAWRLLVMKLLVYHMILDLATKSLSALTLELKERMILLPLNF